MKEARKKIDEIDGKIAKLIDERFDVVEKVGAYKREHAIPVLDAKRESEKINSFLAAIEEEKRPYAKDIIEKIMETSRRYQSDRFCEYGLLGRGLSHSLSPEVHSLFGDYGFGLIDKEHSELEGFLKKKEFKGLCVTMPYKREVMRYCDRISDIAAATDSVNTLVREKDGSISGYNTDYDGFAYTLDRSGVKVAGSYCIVLGSGGVSGTVKIVLEDKGAAKVVIISRKGDDNYENIDRHKDADIVVNATPVGMYPKCGLSPVDISVFNDLKAVFDLIYNPLRTRLMLQAKDMGIPSFGGLQMLVAQAASGSRLFTGVDVTDRVEKVCDKIRKDQENIVLIGMPGCGKTTVGKALADLTGKDFVDMDAFIEEEYHMSPEKIILSEGEGAFRKKEAAAVKRLSDLRGRVIATGGGVVECPENRDPLRESGRIVYIKRNLDELTDEGRPVSRSKGVEELLSRRETAYTEWSDIAIRNTDVNDTAKKIAEELGL